MKRVVVILAMVLSACGTGKLNEGCLSTPDCQKGLTCLELQEDTTTSRSCRVACGPGYPACPGMQSCGCPDSPAGSRCKPLGDTSRGPTDGGTFTGFCL